MRLLRGLTSNFPTWLVVLFIGTYTQIGYGQSGWLWSNPQPSRNILHGLSFTNGTNNTGVAVGEFGTILRTTDGGINWLPVFSGTDKHFRDVYFAGSERGFAVGDSGIVMRTDNSGLN
jgi:photosystem II stability/assembly factor-like uncharacterized protein